MNKHRPDLVIVSLGTNDNQHIKLKRGWLHLAKDAKKWDIEYAKRVRQMLERLSDAEREKADAIASAYKDAMQSQQQNVQQMIGALGQMGQAAAGATPQQPQLAAAPIPPPPQASVGAAWYVAVDGQQTGPFTDAEVQFLTEDTRTAPAMIRTQAAADL